MHAQQLAALPLWRFETSFPSSAAELTSAAARPSCGDISAMAAAAATAAAAAAASSAIACGAWAAVTRAASFGALKPLHAGAFVCTRTVVHVYAW
eukprot:scaffold114111_cov21-Tisochrysis_lutea.AAC.1